MWNWQNGGERTETGPYYMRRDGQSAWARSWWYNEDLICTKVEFGQPAAGKVYLCILGIVSGYYGNRNKPKIKQYRHNLLRTAMPSSWARVQLLHKSVKQHFQPQTTGIMCKFKYKFKTKFQFDLMLACRNVSSQRHAFHLKWLN